MILVCYTVQKKSTPWKAIEEAARLTSLVKLVSLHFFLDLETKRPLVLSKRKQYLQLVRSRTIYFTEGELFTTRALSTIASGSNLTRWTLRFGP